MTKHPEIYYLLDEKSSIVFWTEDEEKLEMVPDLIFIGSSVNPNKRMAVSAFIRGSNRTYGYKIRALG